MPVKVSLKDLLESGAHFGHQSRRWNPKMSQYLHSVQDGVHIFDLIKTKQALEEALEVMGETIKTGKKVLFVGTKKQAKDKVIEVAKNTESFYISERWLGGILTNFDQIQNSIRKLSEMKQARDAGEYRKYTKKERLLLDREITRLERFFGGIAELKELPGLIVVVDAKKEAGAIKEAVAKDIDTIGIVDSNTDPVGISYVIPMNDDATRALDYVLTLMQDTILEVGKKKTKTSSKQ